MSDQYTGDAASPSGKVEQAAQGVGSVASVAKDTAKDTMAEAATQVRSVAAEAKDQVGRLAQQAADEFREQADSRSAQASQGLRSLSTQMDALANGRVEEAGPLVRYVQDGQSRVTSLAERLEQRGAQGVIDDVGAFARRRPGLFLLCAAGAGLVVGRMVRANAAGSSSVTVDESGSPMYRSYDRAATIAGGRAPETPAMAERSLGQSTWKPPQTGATVAAETGRS
jgi:hypothetical protein